MAPAQVCILPLAVGDEEVEPAAEALAHELAGLGLEVVIDDRKERPGVKFAEADLLGWPLQIIIGKRGLAAGEYELKNRSTGAKRTISIDEFNAALAMVKSMPDVARAAIEQILERIAGTEAL